MAELMRYAQLIQGGKTIKQGEIFELAFHLFDAQNVIYVPTVGQTISITIANPTGVVYETTAVVEDNKIKFTVSENIGYGQMRLEIKVTEGTTLIHKYPASGWIMLTITPSLDDAGVGGIKAVTAQQMRDEIMAIETSVGTALTDAADAKLIAERVETEFDQVVAEAGSSNPEIVLARGEFSTLEGRLDDTALTLSDMANEISAIETGDSKLLYPINFTIPDEFKVNIFKTGHGYVTDFDIKTKKIKNGGKAYYVATNGNDANDGLSFSSPLKKIDTALAKVDVETIYMLDGVYFIGENTTGVLTINKSVNIIGLGNPKYICGNKYVWLKTAGQTNVYEISRTSLNKILDLRVKDEFGDYVEMKLLTSILDVNNTPHSYYFDGTKIYVRSFDDKVPDFTFMVYLQPQSLSLMVTDSVNRNQIKLYMENVEVLGADMTMKFTTQTTQTLDNYFYGLNCKFGYSYNSNVVSAYGGRFFLVNCVATHGNLDGFNYHINGAKIPHVLEINCEGRNNGQQTTGIANNGSTMHDGGKIIRLNGEYNGNQGGNVADKDTNTQSVNLNCKAHSSKAVADLTYNSNFTSHTNAEMWVYDGLSYASINDLRVEDGAKIYSKNNQLLVGKNEIVDTGQIING